MISYASVGQFCCEDIRLIENYDKAVSDSKMWVCHHRLETHRRNGKLRKYPLSQWDLKKFGLYRKRPASELVFLTYSEHGKLHQRLWHSVYKRNKNYNTK